MYCGSTCRANHSRERTRKRKVAAKKRSLPEHIRDMKALIKNDSIAFEAIREVYDEAFRENLTTHVKDNVLGALEIMSDMLPKALARLLEDLDSQDPLDRQRAYQILFKYIMPFQHAEGKDANLGNLTVIHQVPIPNTNVGEKVLDEIENPSLRAPYEDELIECCKCHEAKHHQVMLTFGNGRWMCQSCNAREKYKNGINGAGLPPSIELADELAT